MAARQQRSRRSTLTSCFRAFSSLKREKRRKNDKNSIKLNKKEEITDHLNGRALFVGRGAAIKQLAVVIVAFVLERGLGFDVDVDMTGVDCSSRAAD
jgi:hypothetical protein